MITGKRTIHPQVCWTGFGPCLNGVALFICVFLLPDCERVGREGYDRGGVPGHCGHEVCVAILWEVRKLLGKRRKWEVRV